MNIKKNITERGFSRLEFEDLYKQKCSLQASSLATDIAIWLGVNDANPQIMAVDAVKLNIPNPNNEPWVKYPLPEEVVLSTRMHLTIDHVKELLPYLEEFVRTGELYNNSNKKLIEQSKHAKPSANLNMIVIHNSLQNGVEKLIIEKNNNINWKEVFDEIINTSIPSDTGITASDIDKLGWIDYQRGDDGDIKVADIHNPEEWTEEEIYYLKSQGYNIEDLIEKYKTI